MPCNVTPSSRRSPSTVSQKQTLLGTTEYCVMKRILQQKHHVLKWLGWESDTGHGVQEGLLKL